MHAAWGRLARRLTNPPDRPGLADPSEPGRGRAFFPPSRSHEVTLLEKLYRGRPIPDGFDLMGELIRRVRSGEVKLAPAADSGWYDRQAWSLEPLLLPSRMPESERLRMGNLYLRNLEDLFRGALALARETHGQAGRNGRRWMRRDTSAACPDLAAAGRRAAAELVHATSRRLSLRADGAGGGVRLVASGDAPPARGGGGRDPPARRIGMDDPIVRRCGSDGPARAGERSRPRRASSRNGRRASATMTTWVRDSRMMVPVFYDDGRKLVKVWAVLGWKGHPRGRFLPHAARRSQRAGRTAGDVHEQPARVRHAGDGRGLCRPAT